jgi:hypothetical protein
MTLFFSFSQKVFHPPYNPVTILALIGGIVLTGWGTMSYGIRHQQVGAYFIMADLSLR